MAADALSVSRDAVNKATKILKEAAPELVAAVEQGKVSLDAGAVVTTLPVDEQRKVVAQGKVKEKAKEVRQSKKAAAEKAPIHEAKAEGDEPHRHDGAERQEVHTSGMPSDHTEANDSSTTEAEPKAAQDREGLQQVEAKSIATAMTGTEVKPALLALKEAFGVILRAVRKSDPALARKVIDRVATEGGVTVWMPTDEPRDDLTNLEDLVADRLEAVADKYLDDATIWLEEFDTRLREIIRQREPSDDDGAGDDTTDGSDANLADTDGSDDDANLADDDCSENADEQDEDEQPLAWADGLTFVGRRTPTARLALSAPFYGRTIPILMASD